MLIPRVTSELLRTQPDQFVRTINAIIDKLNELDQKIK